MNTLQNEAESLQNVLEQIFPNLSEVPVNSISSSIYNCDDESYVYLLIVGDNALLKPFLNDTNDEAKVKTVLSAKKSVNKIYYDLHMDFAFYFYRGKATFKLFFSAGMPELQIRYLKALKEVENLRFIIADSNKNIQKVVEIDWYYYKNRKVIEKVERYNSALYENLKA